MPAKKPTAPRDLATAGRKLWSGIVGRWELRPDELTVLEGACREADLIEDLRKAFAGEPATVTGSQGQMVIHPIIAELRQHRATQAALLRQLKLPDDNPEAAAAERSAAARAAVNVRWAKRGG